MEAAHLLSPEPRTGAASLLPYYIIQAVVAQRVIGRVLTPTHQWKQYKNTWKSHF